MSWPRALAVVAISLAAFALLWFPAARLALAPESAGHMADFPNYYFGGERLLEGRPVYDSLESEVEAFFGLTGYDTYPADPPPTVVLFSPLSVLSYQTAWKVWQAISAILIFVSVVVVAREVGYSSPVATTIGGVAFLTLPVRFLLERNHMESLLLVLGVFGWRALRHGAEGKAAALWGAATGLKLFPGVWLLGLAVRQRSVMFRGLAWAASLIAVGGVIVGPTNVAQFVSEVVPSSSRWYGTLGNYSLLSIGSAFSGAWLGWVLVTAAVVTLVPLYLRRPSSPDQIYVSGTALALLLSPLSWLNYLVLVIPALVILSGSLDLHDNLRHRLGFATLVVTLCGWGPVVTGSELVSEVLSFVPTYALVALFLVAQNRIEGTSRVGELSKGVG